MKPKHIVIAGLFLALVPGCTLLEVRSKSKLGPEFRHKGSNRTDSVRWYVQQGLQFTWEDKNKNKITTGITYRRRDVDDGGGDNDNGVWLDFSFPIWKAPRKPDKITSRVETLERRIAQLEAERRSASAHPPAEGSPMKADTGTK